jgi:cell division protein FtsQ
MMTQATQGPADRDATARRRITPALRVGRFSFRARRGFGTVATFAFLGAVGIAGWQIGGHEDAMRRMRGSIADVMARQAGFPIREVFIHGERELREDEILAASGVRNSQSLPFLDVAEVRRNLKAVPLVAEAAVRKVYPDKLVITIVEREPFALWQHEGTVNLVSADGTVIDQLRDGRFLRLPHVVGEGANTRVREFAGLLDGAPEMKAKVRAGVLVSGRRWTLKLVNGVDVKLPEAGAEKALAELARLDREAQVLSKDIIAVDLRVAGRVAFRLTEESASERREWLEKKLPKVKGRA